MRLRPILILALALVSVSSVLHADLVDRIAAVVNEDIILLSEIDEKLFVLQAQGKLQGVDSTQVESLRREILDRLIEEKLVVQRASSQGIEPDPTMVANRTGEALERVRSQFPTTTAYRRALEEEGLSENMLRERYEKEVLNELMGQQIVAREVRSKVEVTSDDVYDYWMNNQEQLPEKPAEVDLAHLVCLPQNREREAEAETRIQEIRRRLLEGAEFETMARNTSDDPSAARGGELGWFSPGDLDPDFEAVMDTLKVGRVSAVTRTQFGFHLIRVTDRNDDRTQVSHILAMVKVEPEDVEKARSRAEEAHSRILGGEPFEAVVADVSDDELTRDDGGKLGWTTLALLVPDVAKTLDTLAVGAVGPVVRSDRGFHVFKVINRQHGGTYEYEEIEDRLRVMVEQEKLEEVYDGWMQGIRDSAYIEIKHWDR